MHAHITANAGHGLGRAATAACRLTSNRAVVPRNVSASAIKLYTFPASRGAIVSWYIQELGVEAEEIHVDLSTGKQKAPEYTANFPFGQVPALEDGGLKLFESGAILLYLADKFADKSGVSGPEQRAAAAQWVLFANATLAFAAFNEAVRSGSLWRSAGTARPAARERALPNVMGPLDKILSERAFLEGGRFSVSDVAVGSYLHYIQVFLPQVDLSQWPNVHKYLQRLSGRPAFGATIGSPEVRQRQEQMAKARQAAATASAGKE